MKNVLLTLVLILLWLSSQYIFAQSPDVLWQKILGGDSSDVAYDIEELWDGGFAIVGYTKSIPINDYDIWLIRTDSNGDTLWTKTYGGNGDDYGYSIQKTNDGGFIIGGATNSFGAGGLDFYLVRTDSLGDTLWTKTFGTEGEDIAWSVDLSNENGFVIAGVTHFFPDTADAWIIKTDEIGQMVWQKIYGTIGEDRIYSIKRVVNNGYILAGQLDCRAGTNDDPCDAWIIKIIESGDSIWTNHFGGNWAGWFYSSTQNENGDYVFVGTTIQTPGADYDVWLLKSDSTGKQLWEKYFDYDSDFDEGYSIDQTNDGGYIISGMRSTFEGANVVWVIKTNSIGDSLWTKTIFIPQAKTSDFFLGEDVGLSVKQTQDGGYIVTGAASFYTQDQFDIFLTKIAPDKVPVELALFTAIVERNAVSLNWQTATETNNSGFEIERSPSPTPSLREGAFETIGFVPGFGTITEPKSYSFTDENLSAGTYQYKLKQIDFDGSFEYSNTIEVEITVPLEFSLEQNYPNPFNPSTSIRYTLGSRQFVTLKIFNSLGEEMETLVNEFQEAGVHSKLYIVNSTLPSGVYYYKLRTGSFIETKKMILLR